MPVGMENPHRNVKKIEKPHTRITVTFEPEDHKNLVRTAREKRVSASWVVRDAVRMYFSEDLLSKKSSL
jgi:hypothetical protein